MKRKPSPPPLGEFEILVLLAVLQAGESAYGSVILQQLNDRTTRSVARGALYVTLDRLESKGYLGSRTEEGGAARGGRPRRYYTVRPLGRTLLEQSLDAFARMREGLELGVKRT